MPGVLGLEQQLKNLFPGEDIRVIVSDEALILSGSVSSNAIMLKAAEIATLSSAKLKVINLLQLPGGTESQQVMLQVRFAEVNKSALTRARPDPVRQPQRLGGSSHDRTVRRAEPRWRQRRVQRPPEPVLLLEE